MTEAVFVALRDQHGVELTKRVRAPYDKPPASFVFEVIKRGYSRELALFDRETGGRLLKTYQSTGVLQFLRPPESVRYLVVGEADGG